MEGLSGEGRLQGGGTGKEAEGSSSRAGPHVLTEAPVLHGGPTAPRRAASLVLVPRGSGPCELLLEGHCGGRQGWGEHCQGRPGTGPPGAVEGPGHLPGPSGLQDPHHCLHQLPQAPEEDAPGTMVSVTQSTSGQAIFFFKH